MVLLVAIVANHQDHVRNQQKGEALCDVTAEHVPSAGHKKASDHTGIKRHGAPPHVLEMLHEFGYHGVIYAP